MWKIHGLLAHWSRLTEYNVMWLCAWSVDVCFDASLRCALQAYL
jgi:hypothetical protein